MKRWMLMFLLLLFCSISIVKAEETPSLDLSQYEGKTGRFDTDPEEVAVHTEAGAEMIFAQAHIGMDSSLYYGGYCAAGRGDWDGDGNYFNDVYFNNIQGSPMNEWKPVNGKEMWSYSSGLEEYRHLWIYNAEVPWSPWRVTGDYGARQTVQIRNHYALRWIYAPQSTATLAYCIEMENDVSNSDSFQLKTAEASEYIQKYLIPKNNGKQWTLLQLAMHFAAQAESANGAANSLAGTWGRKWKIVSPYADELKNYLEVRGTKGNLIDWYVASNALMWEIVGGTRTITEGGLSAVLEESSRFRASLEGTPAAYCYDWMVKQLDDRLKLPSFVAKSGSEIGQEQTITLRWDDTERCYMAVVTDTNQAVPPDPLSKTGIWTEALESRGITITYLGNYQYKFCTDREQNMKEANVAYTKGGIFGQDVSGIYVIEANGKWQSAVVGAQTVVQNVEKYLRIQTIKQKRVSLKKETDSDAKYFSSLNLYSLKGAEYGIYSDAECTKQVEILTTDAEGRAISEKLYDVGTKIYVKEIKAPKGYLVNSEIMTCSISENANEIVVKEIPTDVPIDLRIRKYNAATQQFQENGFAGTEFTLNYYDNDTWDGEARWTGIFTTEENGTLKLIQGNLKSQTGEFTLRCVDGKIQFPIGSVTLRETKAPDGFSLSAVELKGEITQSGLGESAVFSLTEESLKQLKKMENDTYGYAEDPLIGSIRGLKQDPTREAVSGAVMGVYDISGRELQRTITDPEGKWQFQNLPYVYAGTRYYIKEIQAPEGYEINPRQYSFVLSEKTPHYDMEREPIIDERKAGSVEVYKEISGAVHEYENISLKGFSFQLTGKNYLGEERVYTAETNSEGIAVFADVSPGEYTLTEVGGGLDGFLYNSQNVLVTAGKKETIRFVNEVVTAHLKLIKQDAEYAERKLAGAIFEIYKIMEDGNEVLYSVMTDCGNGEYVVQDLTVGQYCVKEIQAPENYQLTSLSMNFQVTREDHGKEIEISGLASGNTLMEEPQRGTLEIRKVFEEYEQLAGSARSLQGIRFHVTGQTYDEVVTTDIEGRISLPGLRVGKYRIEEIPDGSMEAYVIPEAQEIEVTEYNTNEHPAVVRFENRFKRGKLVIIKHGATQENRISGAVFRLEIRDYGKEGEEVDEKGKSYAWIELMVQESDERGEVIFENLIAGQYRLTEIQAPKGYQLLMSPVEFSISGKEETLDKTMYIENRPVLQVPSTGGTGSGLYHVLGGGTLLMASKIRKRRRIL